jgi:alkylation response protein AidB-like acyl-CoA dehydrogenase
MAKLYVSESFVKSCLDAIQLHGGAGFLTELELEREMRDSLGSTLYSRHFGDSTEYYRARTADLIFAP